MAIERVKFGTETHTQSRQSNIFFYTSTKKGLGHVSRAVAIANSLEGQLSDHVTIGAYETAQEYISSMATFSPKMVPVSYDFSPTSMPDNIRDEELYLKFLHDNQSWLQNLTDASIVVTDFVVDAVFLRRFFEEQNILGAQIIGVYHSFDGIKPPNIDAHKWQKSVQSIVDSLDVCFLSEPKQNHKAPYITSEGTLVIPTDPIVHPRLMTDAEVKKTIGLMESDEYILIQAGMRGNGALKDFVLSIPEESDEYYVLTGWDLEDETKIKIQTHPRIRVVEKSPYGNEILGAAKGVIAKPGMQTLSEAIAYKVPIIFLPDDHPERRLKAQMLEELLPDLTFPITIESSKPFDAQVQEWLQNREQYRAAFSQISCDGARQVAQYLKTFGLEIDLPDVPDKQRPMPMTSPPPGKSKVNLTPKESIRVSRGVKDEMIMKITKPLLDHNVSHTLIAFGGVSREILRPTSDVDLLLVIDAEHVDVLIDNLGLKLVDPLTPERIQDLRSGKVDALRIKGNSDNGMEVNISLMIPAGYRKMFSHMQRYFKEELGARISDQPYYVGDFRGNIFEVPKVFEYKKDSEVIKERRSPGVTYRGEESTLFGVKHRMLLTAENLHDGLRLGDPTRRIMSRMARAVLYWNDLYVKEDGKIIGIKPMAFDPNYIFRLLRTPLDTVGPRSQRKIRNFYINELRRLQILYTQIRLRKKT